MTKSNVLYVESNVDGTIGGSYFSLYYLISTIDKSKFKPVVVFYRNNKMMEKFRRAGCKVILFSKGSTLQISKIVDNRIRNRVLRLFLKFPLRFIQVTYNVLVDAILPTFKCRKIIKSEKIDIVHLNNTFLRPQEWIFAALVTKTRLIAHERGINIQIPLINRLLANAFDAIICISKAVKDNLKINCRINNYLHLVYNGLDPSEFLPTIEQDKIKSRIGLKDNDLVIGIVGNIKSWKGQDVAVRAMTHILVKYPNAKCLMIGASYQDGDSYTEKIESLIKQNHLRKNIIFTGYRQDVSNYVNVLDILLHTSVLPEPFGRVMLEGMALKKPIITVNIGAGPEIVTHKRTGLVIEPNDERALAEAVISILGNRSLARKMGEAGFARLENYFKISSNTSQTEEIYHSLLCD